MIDLILAGRETWEIRGSATRVLGPSALIESGSGTVVGVAELTGCVGPLTLEIDLPYRRTHAWVLAGSPQLAKPEAYQNPSGRRLRAEREAVRKAKIGSVPARGGGSRRRILP